VALALPWLESLPVLAQDGKPVISNKPPIRFAHVFFSNGVEPIHWWAKGSGAAMEFGKAAEPLKPISEDIVFLRGLYHQKAFTSTSPHLGRMNLLSGAPVSLPKRFASAPASIRFWRNASAIALPCRAWCWASNRTNCGSKTGFR
jgi:hypothetical protein